MGLARHVQADRILLMGTTFRQSTHDSGTFWTTPLRDMLISTIVAFPGPLTSNTSPPSLTPLNSPDRSRCSRVVLFRQKPRAKDPRTLCLTKALGVRGVRGFGPFWPNPSTGRLDGLLGSFMSVWAHQNLRKYKLEGFWGCVLSSRKPQNPRKWRVGCRWGQSL